jgi:hypothetical protein
VSREDIRRDALGQKLDATQTDEVLEFLVRAGFVQTIKVPSGPQGGKPTIRWRVNPLLLNPTAETAETYPVSEVEGVSAVSAVSAPALEENFCAQCGGGNPTLRRGGTWLHAECVRFWKEHGTA